MATATSDLSNQDVATLRSLVEEQWAGAALSRDWDKLLTICAPDIVFMPPDAMALHGHAELRQWLEAFPPTVAFTNHVEQLQGRAPLSFARVSTTCTVEIDGKPVEARGKSLGSFEKDEAGRWLTKTLCFNWDHPLNQS